MNITLVQGLLLALLTMVLAWDWRWESFFAFRPISVCFFAGIILGDVQLGLHTGAIAELSYLGLLTVGGTVPPNPLMAGLMTAVLAYKNGISPETALGLSLPFALLMQWIVILWQSVTSTINARIDNALAHQDIKKFKRLVLLPDTIMSCIYGVVSFLSVYVLQDAIGNFVNSFPLFINHGFEIAGGLLPAVGLALLLKVMVKKENVAYLVIGFVAMSVLSLGNVLPIALIAAAIATIGYLKDISDYKKNEKSNHEKEGSQNVGI